MWSGGEQSSCSWRAVQRTRHEQKTVMLTARSVLIKSERRAALLARVLRVERSWRPLLVRAARLLARATRLLIRAARLLVRDPGAD